MKKLMIGLVAFFIVGGVLMSQYWYYLPGIVSRIMSPLIPNQPVVWDEGPATPEANRPPNIILIVADDLGFNDVTFYGGGIAGGTVPTPNIDSIGTGGVHFPNGYAGNATCAPSRAALLTGRYPSRVGFEFTPTPPEFARLTAGEGFIAENAEHYPPANTIGLPGSELTLPEMLAPGGYHSIALGKWHLGAGEGMTPNEQGFDEYLGFLEGAAMYNDPGADDVVNSKQDFDPIDKFIWANLRFAVQYNQGRRFEPSSHMTDYLSREAVKAIRANKNRPFFMYLAYNAPHTPLQAEKADYDALSHITDHTERVYAAMLRGLDRGIGQVLAALDENGLDENTLVIFTSDNGGAGYVGLADINKPYRGWKITFFEGGIHVPYFMRWPAKIPAGSQYPSAVAHIDIFSTALAAAGILRPEDRVIDGQNILENALASDQPPLMRPLFWKTGGYKVVQQDQWKLQLQEQDGRSWLYNLKDDPTEQVNLAESEPDKFLAMREALYAVDGQMAKPLWPTLIEVPIAVDYTINRLPEGEYETILWDN